MKFNTFIITALMALLLVSCQGAETAERFIGVEIADRESGTATDVELSGGKIPFSVYSSMSVRVPYPWDLYFTTDGSVPTVNSYRYQDWDSLIATGDNPLWIPDYAPHRIRALLVYQDMTARADVTISASSIRPSYQAGDVHTPLVVGKGAIVDGGFSANSVGRSYRVDIGAAGKLKVSKFSSNLASISVSVYSGTPESPTAIATNVANGASVTVAAGNFVIITANPGSQYYILGGNNSYSAELQLRSL